MASNYIEWQFQLFNRRTSRPVSDATGLFRVLTASAATVQTIYKNAEGTAYTQPATLVGGAGRFFTDSSITTVDLTILTASGQSYFVEALTLSQHRVDVDPEKLEYTFICDWQGTSGCGVAAASGFSLLAGMRINDVNIHVTTASTATAYDFGVSGTPKGFGSIVQSSATGWRQNEVVLTSSESATFPIVAAIQKRGSLLVDFATGYSATATAGRSTGFFSKKPYIVTATTALVYGPIETQTALTANGYIYISYDLLPTVGN